MLMGHVRGPKPGDHSRDYPGSTRKNGAAGERQPESQTSNPSGPLTPQEEAELDQIFGTYGEFLDSIRPSRHASFDPCRAVIPLREALKTANLLVECMRQSSAPEDSSVRKALKAQVLDCEEKAADLIGRLSKLRHGLTNGGPGAEG